jgi:hypothetical protein
MLYNKSWGLVSNTNVAISWVTHLRKDKVSFRYTKTPHYTAWLRCNRTVTEYTYDESCNMFLTFYTCDSRDGAGTRKYALCYTGRRRPDANEFQWLHPHLRETASGAPTASAKAGHPRTIQTPPDKDAVLASVNREPWRHYAILHENCTYPNQVPSKNFWRQIATTLA